MVFIPLQASIIFSSMQKVLIYQILEQQLALYLQRLYFSKKISDCSKIDDNLSLGHSESY